MLVAALLFYKKFKRDLEIEGFIFNPYDSCVANRSVREAQQTIRFHVDDLMSSHVNPKVNDDFAIWLNKTYGKHGEVTVTRGNEHEYLGMKYRFNNDEVEINMVEYVDGMLETFLIKFKKDDKAVNPAASDMFKEDNSKKLNDEERELFHKMVAKALFLCKRARPDIQPIVSVLCTRVQKPGKSDWDKLLRMMKYLNGTRKDVLTISAKNGINHIEWYIDVAFAVHPDFKSHTGGMMRFRDGKGGVINTSTKQKVNSNSSTTAELVGVDDVLPLVLWTRLFLEEQGYTIQSNTVFQDNKSAILLEKNGKRSSGKRTRAINIKYFYITDEVERDNVQIQYCPTDEMVGDFMSKGLQGMKFSKFREIIMGNS